MEVLCVWDQPYGGNISAVRRKIALTSSCTIWIQISAIQRDLEVTNDQMILVVIANGARFRSVAGEGSQTNRCEWELRKIVPRKRQMPPRPGRRNQNDKDIYISEKRSIFHSALVRWYEVRMWESLFLIFVDQYMKRIHQIQTESIQTNSRRVLETQALGR
jgi:hypothetical protein